MSDNDKEFTIDDLNNNEDILPKESTSNITSFESSHSTARSFNQTQRGPKITSSVWPFFDKNTERYPGLP
ncbi:14051_t:CDS:1, partial [Acaulospora morrowiae]